MVFTESMNHDKVQNWSGYKRLFPSGNNYFTSGSSTKSISTTASGLMSVTTHHIEQISFFYYCMN